METPSQVPRKVLDKQLIDFTRSVGSGDIGILKMFGIEPRAIASLMEKARALLELGKFERAEQLLTDLSDLVPNAATPAWLLGCCKMKQGKAEHAILAFSRAIERAPQGDEHRIAQRALIERAGACVRLGRMTDAHSSLLAAIAGGDPALATQAQVRLSALRNQEHPKGERNDGHSEKIR